MAEPPVVNASPLIYLTDVGMLDLLREAGDSVIVPLPVLHEVQQFGPSDPAVQALAQTPWLVTADPGPILPRIQAWGLGVGEASVLTWAISHPGAVAILDDNAARHCAAALGLAVRGTVGLVLAAKQRGALAAARPVLEALRKAGMFLSDQVMNQALAKVGE